MVVVLVLFLVTLYVPVMSFSPSIGMCINRCFEKVNLLSSSDRSRIRLDLPEENHINYLKGWLVSSKIYLILDGINGNNLSSHEHPKLPVKLLSILVSQTLKEYKLLFERICRFLNLWKFQKFDFSFFLITLVYWYCSFFASTEMFWLAGLWIYDIVLHIILWILG